MASTYEYKIVYEDSELKFNELGAQGFRLVWSVQTTAGVQMINGYFFERETPGTAHATADESVPVSAVSS